MGKVETVNYNRTLVSNSGRGKYKQAYANRESLSEFIRYLEALPKPCVLYSHNFPRYDSRILLSTLIQLQLHLPDEVFFVDSYLFTLDFEVGVDVSSGIYRVDPRLI